VILIQLAVFVLFGFYNRWWRYVSTRDMWGAARGVTVACLVSEPRRLLRRPGRQVRLPRSVAVMDWLLLLAFVAGARMLARTVDGAARAGPRSRRPRQGGDRRRRR
jgi:FlaA1/EpsC-like NDP-sugar epimerase